MVKVFIKKGILTICLNLIILLVGYYTLPSLSKEFIPSIEVPAVAVIFPTPLMETSRVTKEIVIPVERALSSSGDIESIETFIEDEKVVMILFYKWTFSPEACLQKSRQVIENIKRPKESLAPIFILHRPTNSPILRTAIYGRNIHEITEFSRAIKKKIERIQGVSGVSLSGEREQRYKLNIDHRALGRHKIKLSDIVTSARGSWSINKFIPSSPLPHNLTLEIKDHKQLGMLPLHSKLTDQPILLRWLGKIEREPPTPDVIYGKDQHALILEVIKAPGADTISINEQALTVINNEIKKNKKFNSNVIYNEAKKIIESQMGVLQNFAIGVVLNSLILIAFLGSSIGAVVASVVFPTSLLGTLFIQKTLGISINLFSLNGFSLAVGMITDASTVVLESITRRFQKGEEIFAACWKGTKDVSLGVLASTLTTAGVLIPIALQKNISSKLFSDLSLTVVSTQLLCLIAVFSLVPWLCFKIFKRDSTRSFPIEYCYRYTSLGVRFMVAFAHWIQYLARSNKKLKVVIPSTVVVISLGMLFFLPQTEFLPSISAPVYSVVYPLKKSQADAKRVVTRNNMAKVLGQQKTVLWSIATSYPDRIEVLFELNTVEPRKTVLGFFKDLTIDHKRLNIQMVGPAGSGEKYGYDGVYYLGKDIPAQKRLNLIKAFCSSNIIDYCHREEFNKTFTTILTPRSLLSAQMGGNITDAALDLAIPLRKADLVSLGNLQFKYPVNITIDSKRTLTQLPVAMPNGVVTALQTLLPGSYKVSEASTTRYNSQEFIPLYFRIKNTTIGDVTTFMQSLTEQFKIQKKYIKGMGGIQTMDDSFNGLTEALIISSFIIFIILAVQFRSSVQALIIMGTIPLTLGGAISGLIVMNETVNASVMVGFILLIGIVVNNGIFLVEATNQHLKSGLQMVQAITLSVEERTRPILMTSFSTIFGMLPTILISGEGSELYRGMAIVNVFGMVAGTILSIVITPIFIEIFGSKK